MRYKDLTQEEQKVYDRLIHKYTHNIVMEKIYFMRALCEV